MNDFRASYEIGLIINILTQKKILIKKFFKNSTIIKGYKIGFILYPTEDFIFSPVFLERMGRVLRIMNSLRFVCSWEHGHA